MNDDAVKSGDFYGHITIGQLKTYLGLTGQKFTDEFRFREFTDDMTLSRCAAANGRLNIYSIPPSKGGTRRGGTRRRKRK
jgi:hypothetical protein